MEKYTNVISTAAFETKKRHQTRKAILAEKDNEISDRYKYDIHHYILYCKETNQLEDVNSMLDYLFVSLTVQEVKKTTWERRLAAIKKYLSVAHQVNFLAEVEAKKELSTLRRMYDDEHYKELNHFRGKSAVNKEELLKMIRSLPTRGKAICIINLITACRPNEMVRIKIKDFNLEGNYVSIYMKKQKKWHNKRLTQETVKAVRDYIREYKLKPDDYFVGRVYKNGRFKSVQCSESGYRFMLDQWVGLTGYNFRKTQVSAMHDSGADLPTIAKQTGHKSLETISKHYLSVSDTTVDKYL